LWLTKYDLRDIETLSLTNQRRTVLERLSTPVLACRPLTPPLPNLFDPLCSADVAKGMSAHLIHYWRRKLSYEIPFHAYLEISALSLRCCLIVANMQTHTLFGSFVPFIEHESMFMTDQIRFALDLSKDDHFRFMFLDRSRLIIFGWRSRVLCSTAGEDSCRNFRRLVD